MSALLWKKIKNITQDVKNVLYFFVIPIVVFLILLYGTKNINIVVCCFSFISISLGILFDQMDIENMIHKEYAMYTPMSLKESWIYNSIISWALRFIYSLVIIVLGFLLYKLTCGYIYISLNAIAQGFINGLSAFGIIVFSTQCEVDLSNWKQWLSFMWIIPVFICIMMLDKKISNFIYINFEYCIYLFLFSVLLIFISFFLNRNTSIERYIMSLDGIKKIALVRFNIFD